MKAPRTRVASFVADSSLKGGKNLSRELAAYLLEEGRVDELDSILRDVQADWAKAGYIEVIASSAHPLSAQVKKDIQTRIKKIYPQAKQIIVSEVNDPAVLGGVRLSLPGQQLDLSLEAKLNQFKQLTMNGKE